MNNTASELREFTDWASRLTFADIPTDVVQQAQWCVLDLIGVTIAAAGDQTLENLIAAERSVDSSSDSRVWIGGERFSVPVAARINAFAASLTELADNVAVHANESNIPLALAHADSKDRSGADVLTAIVLGAEAARRMHDVYFNSKKNESEFPIGVPSALNTFGSSFVAAHLFGLDSEQMLDSANASLNLIASALETSVLSGSKMKPLLFGGWPASAGHMAATYARAGITAGSASLDSPVGGWLVGAANEWDLGEFTRDLGTRWELQFPDRKRHASCGFSHAALDAVLYLAEVHDVQDGSEIDSIDVSLFPFAAQAVSGGAEKLDSSNAAKFNLGYLIANVLGSRGVITIDDTTESVIAERSGHEDVQSVMSKVTITGNPEVPLSERFSADVRMTMRDGRVLHRVEKNARGKGPNQLSRDELVEKFLTLTVPVIGASQAHRIIDYVEDMAQRSSVKPLLDLLDLSAG